MGFLGLYLSALLLRDRDILIDKRSKMKLLVNLLKSKIRVRGIIVKKKYIFYNGGGIFLTCFWVLWFSSSSFFLGLDHTVSYATNNWWYSALLVCFLIFSHQKWLRAR